MGRLPGSFRSKLVFETRLLDAFAFLLSRFSLIQRGIRFGVYPFYYVFDPSRESPETVGFFYSMKQIALLVFEDFFKTRELPLNCMTRFTENIKMWLLV